jgi:hypothetical protein
MENHREYFNNLNKNIRNAKSRKTLKILEKQGRKFITNIPDYADSKIKKDCRKEFSDSLKLIKKQHNSLK